MNQLKTGILSFVALLLLTSGNSNAQAYLPFPQHGGVWGAVHQSIICLNGVTAVCYARKTVTSGDTLIDGIHYTRLISRELVQDGSGWLVLQAPYLAGYLRNDSLNKKVYYRESAISNDTLLYDFDLQIGDTLPESYVYNLQNGIITVDAIDTLTENEVSMKRFHLDNAGWGNSYLIEGVGSTLGLFSPIVPFFEFIWEMSCYFNYEKMIFWPGPYCDQITVDVQDIPDNSSAAVYPNPFSNSLNINILNTNKLCTIEIFNTTGQQIMAQNVLHFPYVLNTHHLLPGMYFLKLSSGGQMITMKKLIKNQQLNN